MLAASLALVMTLVANGQALAEGLSSGHERDEIASGTTILTLSPEQDVEVQRRRVFTPTADQLRLLRGIDPTCPTRLRVVTAWHDDCMCGMAGYVFWSRPGEVDVYHHAISMWDNADRLTLQFEAEAGDSTAAALLVDPGDAASEFGDRVARHASGKLVMDLEGRLYCDGDSVDTAAIMAMIDRDSDVGGGLRSSGSAAIAAVDAHDRPLLWLLMPPLDVQQRHTGLFNGILDLAAELARRGWRLALRG